MLLYNKYRPLTLLNIIGHEKIIKDLQKRSKENSFAKTMLFSGKSGLGKTTLERIIAKNILCTNKDSSGNSCNKCDICLTIQNEKPNNFYFEINASNLNLEEVKSLIESSRVKSLSKSTKKVFVIDELQEMKKAQAALKNLLKPLESDIPNTYFILGTMDESEIPTSIKNRCVHYKLKDLSIEQILNYLAFICKNENINIDNEQKAEVLIAIADNSNGSMRTAISYLERCIYSEIWDKEDLLKELNLASNKTIVHLTNMILTNDIKIFEQEINKEIIDKIKNILINYYKVKNKIKLEYYKNIELNGILDIDISIVKNCLIEFFKLNNYAYINQEIIDYTILNIFEINNQHQQIIDNVQLPKVKQRIKAEV